MQWDVDALGPALDQVAADGGLPGWVVHDLAALTEDMPTYGNYDDVTLSTMLELVRPQAATPDEVYRWAAHGCGAGLDVNWDAPGPPGCGPVLGPPAGWPRRFL